ncbi:transcription regulator protein BACH1-like [Xyrichtys novacula]|uniref:Transcription regulator protein BACH1-like n=1 Tax=Xyrichtys novacula TaxID=13765 RepID=A0AAV1FVL1_XYRNO|nr:transcription regulator protein BACH1-like [Xyrichtys novacula]
MLLCLSDLLYSLSPQVTVEGFEPLLQFAYTSKLPFTKENIHAIHSSAEFLGFHNLESACFDFLIPKFSEGKRTSQEVRRRACCQSLGGPSASFGSGVKSSQPNSFDSQSQMPPRSDEQENFPSRCPQSAQGQTNSSEEHLCLENCGPQMGPISLDLTANGVCPMLSLPCPDSEKADHSSQFCERDILEIEDVCDEGELSLAECDLPCELSAPGDVNATELIEAAGGDVKQTVETLRAETNCDPGSCPLNTSGVKGCSDLIKQDEAGLKQSMAGDLSDAALTALSQEEGFGERSSVEREVAEHLAKGFWPDLCPSQTQPIPLDPMDQNNLAKASDFHWLKQLDLSSSVGDCPFLRDLAGSDDTAQRTDNLSQSEKSPCLSSSFNSGDDSELDTDGDTEATNKRAAEIQLPFPVEQISALSRSAFQQLLKRHQLTPEQLEFVHDIRRRSKNRVAAQRCRKRKLDSIHELECEIKKLKSEKERLLQERTELEQNLEETRHSLCGLCKSVSIESGSDHEHLQILAKLSASDLSTSSSDLPFSSPCLLGKDDGPQITIEMVSCSPECDTSKLPAESGQSTASEAGTQTGPPQSSPDPAPLLNACLDMTNIL